jgi:hypothetical protein
MKSNKNKKITYLLLLFYCFLTIEIWNYIYFYVAFFWRYVLKFKKFLIHFNKEIF